MLSQNKMYTTCQNYLDVTMVPICILYWIYNIFLYLHTLAFSWWFVYGIFLSSFKVNIFSLSTLTGYSTVTVGLNNTHLACRTKNI